MAISTRARSPVAAFMGFASLVLFAFAGYLTYRAVTQHNESAKALPQTCEVTGDSLLVDIINDPVQGYMLVYETLVEVSGGPGTGYCDIAVACASTHYSGGTMFCDSPSPMPLTVKCWNTANDSMPVCIEPGVEWKSSMVGAIVTWVFAIAFVVIAFMLPRSVTSSPMVPVETVTVVRFPGEPAVAGPVLMGAPVVVTGTPIPADQQAMYAMNPQPVIVSGAGYPISAGEQYPPMDPPVIAAQPYVEPQPRMAVNEPPIGGPVVVQMAPRSN